MHHHGAVRRLPVELLSHILALLALEDLLAASRVSSFWRSVAFRQPVFWRDVTLTSLTTPALDLYNARLAASSTESISISIRIRSVLSPSRLRSAVLPAIAGNLHRIDCLSFKIALAYDSDIFNSLLTPAPRLHTLDIHFVHPERISSGLPVDLFARHAPNLQNLRLQQVMLKDKWLPQSFYAVKVLAYGSRVHHQFPLDVFAHCTALQELHISGDCMILPQNSHIRSIRAAYRLVSLDIATTSNSYPLVRELPCASIPYTCVPLYGLASALLLGHLHGSLEFGVFRTGEELVLQYTSLSTDMRRAFLCPSHHRAEDLPAVHTSSDLLDRIECIRASGESSIHLPALTRLRSCTRIALALAEGAQLKPPFAKLHVPELRDFGLSYPVETPVELSALVDYLRLAFVPVSHVVHVTLEGVTLVGDVREIPAERYLVSSAPPAPIWPNPRPPMRITDNRINSGVIIID